MKNLGKHICFVILLCLGFSLMPDKSYACAKEIDKSELNSCSKDQSSKAEKKNSCKTKSHQKDSVHHDCSGECIYNSCHCPASPLSIAVHLVTEIKNHNIFLEKLAIDYNQSYVSSGFRTIWLPPKIS